MGFNLKRALGNAYNTAVQVTTGGTVGYNPDNNSYGSGVVGERWRKYNPVLNAMYNEAGAERKKEDIPYDPSAAGQRRRADFAYGRELGQKEFYDDPDMQRLRAEREDLAKGFSGKEMGAMRGESKANIEGQRSNYLRQLQSNLARSGVGGARGAAMQNAANQGYAKQGAEAERKLVLDQAGMKRQGVADLQDYISRQKLGALGLAYGQQALGSADYAAEKGVQAAQSGGKK